MLIVTEIDLLGFQWTLLVSELVSRFVSLFVCLSVSWSARESVACCAELMAFVKARGESDGSGSEVEIYSLG